MASGDFPIRMNLFDDLRAALDSELTTQGFKVPSAARSDPDAMSVLYFNVLKRWIVPSVRETKWSHELTTRLPSLPSDIVESVRRITHESESGKPLSQYLSKRSLQADFDDLLMNDWGINHLHLGAPQSGSFSGRRSELLFVFPTDAVLHFVDVLDHQSFSSSHLIEVVHLNWPKLISRFRCKGTSNLEPRLSDLEREEARKAGLLAFIETADGSIYAPPGGGITTDQTGLSIRTSADQLLNEVAEIEELCREQASVIAQLLAESEGVGVGPLHVRLRLESDGIVVFEPRSGARIQWTRGGKAFITRQPTPVAT